MPLTRDHVVPRALGGSNRASNMAWACYECNQLKGDMSPDEWSFVTQAIPEWWRLARMRGPRGSRLVVAMAECGFDFKAAPGPYERWWAA
jgi:hypothetical protein